MFADNHSRENLRRRQQQQNPNSSSSNGRRRRQRTASSPRRQQRTDDIKSKNHSLLLLSFLAGLGLWYWTPISDVLTTILLRQVPLEADIALGRQAKRSFPYPTIQHRTWSPIVSQVGNELVTALAMTDDPRHILGSHVEDAHSSSSWVDVIMSGLDAVLDNAGTTTNHKNLADRYRWDFGVVQAPLVNAFALPGGVIRVTDQLLEQLSPTRGELAALLGHEMGHVLHRHSQARILQTELFQKVVAALTYEDHDEDDETFGQALGELLLQSANWFGQQKFSRANEFQADATGWNLLRESQSYNPQAVKSLLDKLWALEGRSKSGTGGKNDGGPALAWTSTHPATEDRIGALEQKWQHLTKRERRRLQSKVS